METKEALEILSDGHGIISPETAEEVCRSIGVPFDRGRLVRPWHSDPPGTPKGLTMGQGMEGTEGVYSLVLSTYVARSLGVLGQARACHGRGFQAREYVRVIKVALQDKG